MTIAALYVMNHKELNTEKLLNLAEQIRKKAGFFTTMQSHTRYTTAAALDVNFEQPEDRVDTLFHLYDELKNAKFSSGVYTYLAASIILTNEKKDMTSEQIIQRAKVIYDGMKVEHPFLTGSSDYPLAVMLAYEDQPDIIQQMEDFYENLSENGFQKGNDLQFLSHILTLNTKSNAGNPVSRAATVSDEFRQAGIRPKGMYYPIIGMLALLPREEFKMYEITNLYDQLNAQKAFKWQKDMNLIMAVAFYVNYKLEHHSLPETSLYTTLEMLLQAQQAVMIATIASTTAAVHASDNSSNN